MLLKTTMDNLFAARSQMAVSFIFHIVFACIGIAMPWLMFIAEWKWLKTGKAVYLDLAKAWSKGVAIFFAIGAVSGTLLSFELGLLWPRFMKHAGAIIGMPFSWEGTAFFLEAIALGIFLYGWNRVNKWVHLSAGLVIGISGVISGIFVIAANSWMNNPAGFDWVNGQTINIDPVKAMFNNSWFQQALHMTLAAFASTCFAVAGVHAYLAYKNKLVDFHTRAIKIALSFGAVAGILLPLSGDISAKNIAKYQPAKLAAMESLFQTSQPASLIIGGIPDLEKEQIKYAIKIPYMLSFLAHGNFDARVTGLDQFEKSDWPPVKLVHASFQLMVFFGVILLIAGVIHFFFMIRKVDIGKKKWWLKILIILTPIGFMAVQAGWMVTELGRQPWIIQGIMRTKDAVTPMPGITYSFLLITLIYILLSLVVFLLLKRQIRLLHENYKHQKSLKL